VDGHERLAGDDERGRIGAAAREVPPQRDDRQETDDADGDDRGLDYASGDDTKRHALVLPPDHREDRDGATDSRGDQKYLKERRHQDARVGAGAEDVVGIVEHGPVEDERGNRGDEGDEVQHARDERGLPERVHGASR